MFHKKMATTVASCLLSLLAFSQFSVRGKVESNGMSLPGASISIQNSYKGTVSGADGEFNLGKFNPGEFMLEVSYVGYEKLIQKVVVKNSDLSLKLTLTPKAYQSDEVIVSATRADKQSPFATSELSKEQLAKNNLGQDLPILLNQLPSVVTTSDAGNGIGYTGIRVRGSDASKVNVTINGIPLNDAESQGTFWVNMPDFASSVQSIQLQRGVGTSTNGAGAFGASLNLATNAIAENAYGEINNSFGSFNSRKHTVAFGSGLIDSKFSVEGRLSKIKSDGYVDRASSDLQSYYLQGAYLGKKSLLKVLIFGGQEETYQAYYGLDAATLAATPTRNFAGEIYDSVYNVKDHYKNQVDHYNQDHYQVHYGYTFNANWSLNTALHYTFGRGYYEEYRQDERFSKYRFAPVILGTDTITSTDLTRRRWLSNDFYGATYSLNYQKGNLQATFGGAYNIYDGKHYGEILWARYASQTEPGYHFYDGNGLKKDFNAFLKVNYNFKNNLNAFADLQIRKLNYTIGGTDNGFVPLDFSDKLNFFNPKFGLVKQISSKSKLYASYAIAHREPNRNDYVDAPNGIKPLAETLQDLELGGQIQANKFFVSANIFHMNYTNQLVLTGAINDVGAFIRSNSGKSFRSGIELQASYQPYAWLKVSPNLSVSTNKNKNYINQSSDSTSVNLGNTDIAYSPQLIAANTLEFKLPKGISVALLSKYVGKQQLDNTASTSLKLDAYFVNDLRINYNFKAFGIKNIGVNALVNNVFNVRYSSNGYVYDGTPYYFTQAGTNFLVALNIKF